MRHLPAAIALLLSSYVQPAQVDWPQWLGPNRNGISKETEWASKWPPGGPKRLWTTNVGAGHSAVAVSEGLLYTMGNRDGTDTVYCMRADTGDIAWKHAYPCEAGRYPGPHSTPTVDRDRVYTFSRKGHLFCFEAGTGNVVWSRDVAKELYAKGPRWDYACSPLVLGRKLIVETGAEAGSVVAFDKANGEVIWQSGSNPTAHSSPVAFELGGSSCIAVFAANALVAMDAEDGRQLWRYPWKSNKPNASATPLVWDDKVFISSAYGGGCALLKMTREGVTEVWRNRSMSNHFNNCMLWEGYLYGTHGHTGRRAPLRCLDARTGEVMWSEPMAGGAGLLLAGDRLILITGRGELIVAKLSTTRFIGLSRAKVLTGTCWTPPVLSSGRIYCRNNDGDLVCLDVCREPGEVAG